ncbi:MAG TPA: CDP-alcohol phosphatidyltransferase family protein [Enteractinococcus helveticum]|uniref:CDP-alcohol phosphatidyltransferase family protein n=1 Tax=Enteractinococcus helveticum TaxID=1837282 RepID=A0A921FPL6_9MICC|nr:CDP-alcohol phosphatidyltransferase family protein [Enteractinococcus helveticum]HJF15595.1 CDP-alcohol phosphatidyltransferase family protein [Enteractinococcus helveticum]
MNRSQDPTSDSHREATVTDDWFTIPNLITMVRFILVPVFVWFMFDSVYWHALLTLVVLFSTDWIDGFLARKLNQVSTVGQWLDPLADRLSLWVVVITVVLSGIAPLWLVFTLVVPDLVLAGIMALLYTGNPQMKVTLLGKARTAALMVGVPLLLFAETPFVEDPQLLHTIAIGVLAIGAAGHIVASVDYVTRGVNNAIEMRRRDLSPRSKADRETFLESHS